MTWLKKWWIAHAATLTGLAYYLLPSVQAYVNAHPKTTVGLLLGAVLVAFRARAPKDQL